MNSRRRNHKRSKWAHVNTPAGLRNRSAKADARREAIAARIVDPYRPPEPLALWQAFTVELYVPTSGRCDQHAVVINGERVGLLSATQIATKLRGMIKHRPSLVLQAEIRREEWLTALHFARLAVNGGLADLHEAALAALHPADLRPDCGFDPHAP